jgi:hypothetical protein
MAADKGKKRLRRRFAFNHNKPRFGVALDQERLIFPSDASA